MSSILVLDSEIQIDRQLNVFDTFLSTQMWRIFVKS